MRILTKDFNCLLYKKLTDLCDTYNKDVKTYTAEFLNSNKCVDIMMFKIHREHTVKCISFFQYLDDILKEYTNFWGLKNFYQFSLNCLFKDKNRKFHVTTEHIIQVLLHFLRIKEKNVFNCAFNIESYVNYVSDISNLDPAIFVNLYHESSDIVILDNWSDTRSKYYLLYIFMRFSLDKIGFLNVYKYYFIILNFKNIADKVQWEVMKVPYFDKKSIFENVDYDLSYYNLYIETKFMFRNVDETNFSFAFEIRKCKYNNKEKKFGERNLLLNKYITNYKGYYYLTYLVNYKLLSTRDRMTLINIKNNSNAIKEARYLITVATTHYMYEFIICTAFYYSKDDSKNAKYNKCRCHFSIYFNWNKIKALRFRCLYDVNWSAKPSSYSSISDFTAKKHIDFHLIEPFDRFYIYFKGLLENQDMFYCRNIPELLCYNIDFAERTQYQTIMKITDTDEDILNFESKTNIWILLRNYKIETKNFSAFHATLNLNKVSNDLDSVELNLLNSFTYLHKIEDNDIFTKIYDYKTIIIHIDYIENNRLKKYYVIIPIKERILINYVVSVIDNQFSNKAFLTFLDTSLKDEIRFKLYLENVYRYLCNKVKLFKNIKYLNIGIKKFLFNTNDLKCVMLKHLSCYPNFLRLQYKYHFTADDINWINSEKHILDLINTPTFKKLQRIIIRDVDLFRLYNYMIDYIELKGLEFQAKPFSIIDYNKHVFFLCNDSCFFDTNLLDYITGGSHTQINFNIVSNQH